METRLSARFRVCVGLIASSLLAFSLSSCKIGPFTLPFGERALGITEVDEAGLDTVVGSYSYAGEHHNITVRDVLNSSASLDFVRGSDGGYPVPTADDIIGYARNKIILEEAQNRGLEVSPEEVLAYARDTFGMDDFAMLGLNFGMDAEAAERLMTDAALMAKLRGQVVTTTTTTQMPELPEAPEAGSENTPTEDYAKYVLALVGSEWDSEHNSWADTTGPYYEALSGMVVSNEEASYEAALAAYYVAYNIYGSETQFVMGEWTEFVNTLLSQASIEIATLAA